MKKVMKPSGTAPVHKPDRGLSCDVATGRTEPDPVLRTRCRGSGGHSSWLDSERRAAPPGVDMPAFTYGRDPVNPPTNTQSTYITYNYAAAGSYPVT